MTIKHLILPFFLLVFSLAAYAADVSNDALIDQLLADQRGTPDAPARRAELQREIVVQDALIKEAQKQGLTQTPAFMARMELARRGVIVETYWRAFLEKHPLDPAAGIAAPARDRPAPGRPDPAAGRGPRRDASLRRGPASSPTNAAWCPSRARRGPCRLAWPG